MRSRAELVGESAHDPRGVAEYAFELQEQLAVKDRALSQKDQLLAQREQLLSEKDWLLAEVQHRLAEKEQLLAEARSEHVEDLRALVCPHAG